MSVISKIKDNIVTLSGKAAYKQDEYYKLSAKTKGIVLSATDTEAKLLVIGNPSDIKVNATATATNDSSKVPVYDYYFGKIISPFGSVVHPQNFSMPKSYKTLGVGDLGNPSPAILDRVPLSTPLDTGILAIDSMIPIGQGQRELIIGDRNTGKTSIALNAIINQKNSGIKAIYIAIGQKRNSIISVYNKLKEKDAIDNVIVLFANADSPGEQFLAPKIGMAMAEALAYNGENVVVVIDDLTKHANIYREISLSIGSNPGREAYPADVFFQHASLLEKAGKFGSKYKNGSITVLPIVETIQNDIASLIPSNVISITDGQIFTSTDMFNNGEYPAINIQRSVSRTGTAVQSKLIKRVSSNLKASHATLSEIKKFSDMSIDVSEELEKKIERWNGINNIILQFGYGGYSREVIVILIEMYNVGVMGKLIDPQSFSLVIQNFVATDAAAKKVARKIADGKISDDELLFAIRNIFVPLAKTASGEYGNLFSKEELEKLKVGK